MSHPRSVRSSSRRPAVAFLTAFLWVSVLAGGLVQADSPEASRDASGLRYLGSASCAAVACHGESGDFRRTGGEWGIWLQRDPHARAQSVLYEKRSQEIGARLGIASVQRSERCTSCHAQEGSTVPDIDRPTLLSHGVGCESCHGPAERWIEPHKRLEWTSPEIWSDERKAALGFRMTKDPLFRTETCAGCHIGGPGRDMNHDLIAAGHPRLAFEMASYHARLPKHWGRSEDLRRNSPVLEARLWLAGQVASLDASLGLLEERAKNIDAPWPEFSEYTCSACHHNLTGPPDARSRSALESPRIAVPKSGFTWSGWYQTFAPLLAEAQEAENGTSLSEPLDALRTEIERTNPSRAVVLERIEPVRAWLERSKHSARGWPLDESRVRELSLRLAADGEPLVRRDWDSATQLFLGLSALHYAESEASGQFGAFKTPRKARIEQALLEYRAQLTARDRSTAPRQLGTREFQLRVSGKLKHSLDSVRNELRDPP